MGGRRRVRQVRLKQTSAKSPARRQRFSFSFSLLLHPLAFSSAAPPFQNRSPPSQNLPPPKCLPASAGRWAAVGALPALSARWRQKNQHARATPSFSPLTPLPQNTHPSLPRKGGRHLLITLKLQTTTGWAGRPLGTRRPVKKSHALSLSLSLTLALFIFLLHPRPTRSLSPTHHGQRRVHGPACGRGPAWGSALRAKTHPPPPPTHPPSVLPPAPRPRRRPGRP